MKKLAGFLAVFLFVTATAAIFDKGWIEETFKDPESIAGWILGGSFGSIILYMFIRGAINMWPVLVTTFGISRPEVTGLAAA